MRKSSAYYVYILKCADGTFYTGITNDLAKRVETHNTGKTAAKYTRALRPVKLVYSEKVKNRSAVLKREWEIKKMRRSGKMLLLSLKK